METIRIVTLLVSWQSGATPRQTSSLLFSTLLYSSLPFSSLLFSSLLYSTLLYSTLLFSSLLFCSFLFFSSLFFSSLLSVVDEGNRKGKQERRGWISHGFRTFQWNKARWCQPTCVGWVQRTSKATTPLPTLVERSPPSPLFHPRRPTSPPTYTAYPTYTTLERPPSLWTL